MASSLKTNAQTQRRSVKRTEEERLLLLRGEILSPTGAVSHLLVMCRQILEFY